MLNLRTHYTCTTSPQFSGTCTTLEEPDQGALSSFIGNIGQELEYSGIIEFDRDRDCDRDTIAMMRLSDKGTLNETFDVERSHWQSSC